MQTTKLALTAVLTSAPFLATPFTAAYAASPTPIHICTGNQQIIKAPDPSKIFILGESKSSDPSVARLGFQNYYKEAIIRGVAQGGAKVMLSIGQLIEGRLSESIAHQEKVFDVTVKNCVKIDAEIQQKPPIQQRDPSKPAVPIEPAYRENLRTGQ